MPTQDSRSTASDPTPSAGAPAAPSLLRAIGVVGLAAGIFNCTVGGGIFRLPAGVAAAAGTLAPLVYLICAVIIGCVVLCFAQAGSRVPLTGGPYAYVERVFGGYVGFLAGALLWMTGTTATAGVASACAEGIAKLLGQPNLYAPILVCMFTGLVVANVRGVKQGTGIVVAASVAKLVPLLVLVLVGVFFIEPANLTAPVASGSISLARAAVTLIFAFSGVESALVPSGEVKNAVSAVPRALALAMSGVTLLYLSVHLVAQGVLGPELATATSAPLALAAQRFLGAPGGTLLLVGASISMFGYVSGMTLSAPRVLWKFSQQGLLPPWLGAVHSRYRTPYVAIILQTLLVCAVALFHSFEQLTVISNLAALLLYAACAVATMVLRQRDVRLAEGTPFNIPGGKIVPLVTLALIAWLLTSITLTEWTVMAAALVGASLLFALAARTRRNTASP